MLLQDKKITIVPGMPSLEKFPAQEESSATEADIQTVGRAPFVPPRESSSKKNTKGKQKDKQKKAVEIDSGLKSIALNIKRQNSVNLTAWDAINCEMIKQVTTKFF